MIKEVNGIIKINGRIDSANAKKFEEEMLAFDIKGDVTIDASELEYISSAGLRVFLKLKKKADANVIVTNVSPEIYDIFEVTGFTSILNVKKALRNMSVNGLEVIGKGATGTVYRMDNETIIKVFNENVGLNLINNEGKKAKAAFIFGVPTAISYDTVKVGNCYGVIYELLNAKDLLTIIRNDKEHIEEHVKNFALKIKSMHQIEVDDTFNDIKQGTIDYLGSLEGLICSADEVKKIRAVIGNIPGRNTFIHGDAHIGNVMVQNGEYMFIDLSSSGKGHPILDLVSMCSCFKLTQSQSQEAREAREITRGFSLSEIELIWNTFLKTYLGTNDENYLKKAEEQILAVTYSRIILAAVAIPGLFSENRLESFKSKAIEYYDKGLEPICF